MNDLTAVLLTSNTISTHFFANTFQHLINAKGSAPLIVVSKQDMEFSDPEIKNLVFDKTPRSHFNIYREALAGVKEAKTKYVAICEDDVLYVPEHFKERPTADDVFAYNACCWGLFTWGKPPTFSLQGRKNHGMLICARDLYIEAMEERFAKYPDDSMIKKDYWAEPGKYEKHLGVKVQKSEFFQTHPPVIMFTHPEGLSQDTIGFKKRMGKMRAYDIPYWGKAEDVLKLYEE